MDRPLSISVPMVPPHLSLPYRLTGLAGAEPPGRTALPPNRCAPRRGSTPEEPARHHRHRRPVGQESRGRGPAQGGGEARPIQALEVAVHARAGPAYAPAGMLDPVLDRPTPGGRVAPIVLGDELLLRSRPWQGRPLLGLHPQPLPAAAPSPLVARVSLVDPVAHGQRRVVLAVPPAGDQRHRRQP